MSEYLPKPLTRDMVQTLLRPKLLGDVGPDPIDRGGHVVAVCGAQGGAGATSIAINLALQLAETTKAKVALLDLHLQGGEAAVMLGVRPGPGLRIALENPMRADTLFLERAAIEVNDRVRLIAADEALDARAGRSPRPAVRHVLGLLRQQVQLTSSSMSQCRCPGHPLGDRPVAPCAGADGGGGDRAAQRQCAPRDRDRHRRQEPRVHRAQSRQSRRAAFPWRPSSRAWAKPDMVIPDLGKRMTEAVNQGIPALRHVRKLQRCALAPLVREIPAVGRGTRSVGSEGCSGDENVRQRHDDAPSDPALTPGASAIGRTFRHADDLTARRDEVPSGP